MTDQPSRRLQTFGAQGSRCIIIGPNRSMANLASAAFAAVVTVGFIATLAYGIGQLISGFKPPIGAVIFMALCGLGGLFFSVLMVANLGWKLLGREQITLDGSKLTLTAVVVGIRRERAFPIRQVGDVQVFERFYRAKGHPMVRRTVGFKFEGREVRAISQVSQPEAEYIRVWLEHELKGSSAATENHTATPS